MSLGTFGQNLLLRSEELTAAEWSVVGVTVTAGAGAAPDGALTAASLAETAVNNAHVLRPLSSPVAFLAGRTYTFAAFLKAAGGRYVGWFADLGAGGTFEAVLDAQTGLVTEMVATPPVTVSASVVDIGSGWYRLSVTFSTTVDVAGSLPQIAMSPDGTATLVYLGDPARSVLVWGLQVTQANQAGAYVRSYGVADAGPIRNRIA